MSGIDYSQSMHIISLISWIFVLVIFAVAVGLPQGSGKSPGSEGHRAPEDDTGHEEIRGDGFIDSFSGEIEEAGGGLPLLVKIALPGILIWWLIYLILNWAQP